MGSKQFTSSPGRRGALSQQVGNRGCPTHRSGSSRSAMGAPFRRRERSAGEAAVGSRDPQKATPRLSSVSVPVLASPHAPKFPRAVPRSPSTPRALLPNAPLEPVSSTRSQVFVSALSLISHLCLAWNTGPCACPLASQPLKATVPLEAPLELSTQLQVPPWIVP